MKRLVTISAFAAVSSALFMYGTAQACDGQEGKRSPLASMDANADGRLTQQEMLSAWTARFDATDADKDGKITAEEREAAHAARMKERLSAMDTNKNGAIEQHEARGPLARFFTKIDADGNGSLSNAELTAHRGVHAKERARTHRADHDQPTTKAELTAKVGKHFSRLDKNGDGVLSGDELARFHRGGRGHRGPFHRSSKG